MAEAILIMTAKRFGCVGVVDESGVLAGIITDGDLRRHMDNDLLGQRAAEQVALAQDADHLLAVIVEPRGDSA